MCVIGCGLRPGAPAISSPFLRCASCTVFRAGIPRVVNVLCDRALLAGYAAGAREIGPAIVRAAAAEVRGDGSGGWLRRRLARPALLDVSLATALLLLCGALVLALANAPRIGAVPGGGSRGGVGTAPGCGDPGRGSGPRGGSRLHQPLDRERTRGIGSRAGRRIGVRGAGGVVGARGSVDRAAAYAPSPTAGMDRTLPPLSALLAEVSGETSAANALGALIMAWGLTPEPATARSLEDVLDALSRRHFGVLPLAAGDLASLRVLNHPALLRIKAADGAPRLVVLRTLDPWQATLQGVGPSGAVRVSAAELEALWGGEAWVPWRDFEGLPDVLQVGGSGPSMRWLQQSLTTLGFYSGPPNGRFDAETQAAVRAFQRSRDLSEDGAVGPRTKMALYDSLGRYQVPRLQTGREVR